MIILFAATNDVGVYFTILLSVFVRFYSDSLFHPDDCMQAHLEVSCEMLIKFQNGCHIATPAHRQRAAYKTSWQHLPAAMNRLESLHMHCTPGAIYRTAPQLIAKNQLFCRVANQANDDHQRNTTNFCIGRRTVQSCRTLFLSILNLEMLAFHTGAAILRI